MKSDATFAMRLAGTGLYWMMAVVAVIDLVLIVTSGYLAVGDATRLTAQLNLGLENNAAVWWSSATLLFAGLLLFDAAFKHAGQRTALLIIAALLVFLSLDEMGSLHERIYNGSIWSYVPYALAGGLSFLYAFWRLYNDPTLRPVSIVLFIGFSCFGSVVIQEFFEHNVDWPIWALGLRVGIEEGTELLGTALCLYAAGKLLGFDKSPSLTLPDLDHESKSLTIGVAVVMIAAAIYTAFVAPNLTGYPVRGNPALWFAMAAFFYLAYHTARGQNVVKAVQQHFFVICVALVASLAQCMFVFTRVDLGYLIAVDGVVLIAVMLRWLVWRDQTKPVSKSFLVIGVALIALLAFFGVSGVAGAGFLMSFAVAVFLLAWSVLAEGNRIRK